MRQSSFLKVFLTTIICCFIVFAGVMGYRNREVKDPDPVEEVEELLAEGLVNNDSISVLVLGVDKTQALSDVIMYVKYNALTNKAAMISIPRDTNVELPGVKHRKINSVFGSHKNGALLTMEAAASVLGENMDYFAVVDFKGVENIIDIIGGVEVDVKQDMKYSDPVQDLHIDIKKGLQVLNGHNSLDYLRYRKGYPDQDLGRIRAQQGFIDAFLKKLISPQIITKGPALLNEMGKNIKTNATPKVMTKYALELLQFQSENIKMYTLPWVIDTYTPDEEKINEMMTEINNYLLQKEAVSVEGETPESTTE